MADQHGISGGNAAKAQTSPWLSPATLSLALSSLGIVYGDIGTSPLYAVRECFHGTHAVSLTEGNIFGVLSLVFWSMTMVICIKYVVFVMRADNRSMGGIFALLALIPSDGRRVSPRLRAGVVVAAILGASLLYGDGVITPAISVLSAIEGLEVATEAARPLVLPLTCGILLLLFLVQHRGTADIGSVFGPIMIVWFFTIAFLGGRAIVERPEILRALNPFNAYEFFAVNRVHGLVVLGSVVLCITGGEALYADMGHFGRNPIRLSWLGLAFPALLLNYFGQGALLLKDPNFAFNPFYGLVPRTLLYPMVFLSTVATIIASQAMISGIFSLTQQAVQLGLCPRVRIVHTSRETEGQIYIPEVNYLMMVACIGLVVVFKKSSGLAGAYGIAVTADMAFTSVLFFFVITKTWGWSLKRAIPLLVLFLIFDLSYFGANLLKVFDGGWVTLTIAAVIAVAMTTWKDGRAELARKMLASRLPVDIFLSDVAGHNPPRVRGTAIFMSVSPVGIPISLLHHYKHNQVLHEKVVLLSIRSTDAPVLQDEEKVKIEDLGQGFYRIVAFYGFAEKPNVPEIMRLASLQGLVTDPATTTYFLSRESLLTGGDSRMMRWRKALFVYLSRNAGAATAYFDVPPDRVVELGLQIQF
ncbi:MAG TPA: KUP/HAK/KT family potassium transporter [Syntrophobacteraceae bacterium]|nr:KUP/HAK/KT family potassium transporter [Syntrophobacteraceae bacterium]